MTSLFFCPLCKKEDELMKMMILHSALLHLHSPSQIKSSPKSDHCLWGLNLNGWHWHKNSPPPPPYWNLLGNAL
jgi:hypothetical protein